MKAESLWGTAEVVLSAPVAITAEQSQVDATLSLVPNDFQVGMEPGTGPTSLTQIWSVRIPCVVAADQRLVGYFQEIALSVLRSPDVRVFILMDLAGTVKTIEYDFSIDESPVLNEPLRFVRVFSQQGLESSSATGVGLFGPVADYVATISVTIQRRSLKGIARVGVDTLDVSMILDPPIDYSEPTPQAGSSAN